MSEGDCVQAATVNRRAKYTRHSNPDVGLFMERGDGSDAAAFIADLIKSSGSSGKWNLAQERAQARPGHAPPVADVTYSAREKRCC